GHVARVPCSARGRLEACRHMEQEVPGPCTRDASRRGQAGGAPVGPIELRRAVGATVRIRACTHPRSRHTRRPQTCLTVVVNWGRRRVLPRPTIALAEGPCDDTVDPCGPPGRGAGAGAAALAGAPPRRWRPPARPVTVALARQAGTPGTSVAHALGARLGWTVYDHELLDRIAQETGLRASLLESVDERHQSWLVECIEAFAQQPAITASYYV